MNILDVYSLLIGYGIFCVGIFVFVMLTVRKFAPDTQMPSWLWFYTGLVALCPIVNIVMLINTIKVRKADGNL